MISKIADAGRIAVMGYCTVFVLENFHFDLAAGITKGLWVSTMALVAITLLMGIKEPSPREKIQTVFEKKGIKAGDEYPRYVKGE